MSGMTILGIDPGLERVGFGVVRRDGSTLTTIEYGLIQTSPGPLPSRLATIHAEVCGLITKHSPDAIATERLLFAANRTTAFDVARALGAILLAAAETGLPWTEYSPPEVKKAVVGNGSADKKQVQYMIVRLLSLKETPKPDDVADALAIAVCHAMRSRIQL